MDPNKSLKSIFVYTITIILVLITILGLFLIKPSESEYSNVGSFFDEYKNLKIITWMHLYQVVITLEYIKV